MLFDTHAHLDDEQFNNDREAVIENIKNSGVTKLVNVGADINSSINSINLSKKYDFIYAAVGCHPEFAMQMNDEKLAEIKELAKNEKVVAIGEIGLDMYYDNGPLETQKYWFKKQLDLAEELNLPVIIHTRDAMAETLEMLRNTNAKGIVHCYSGSAETAIELVKMGFYIAFGGVVTFKNAKNAVLSAEAVPLDKLLIETDCPYLAPEGFRGTRNDSSKINIVCRKLAQIKKVDFAEMAEITYNNACKVYNIY